MLQSHNLFGVGQVSWDSDDLIQCKQALLIIANANLSRQLIESLDFGSLDVQAVLDEAGYLQY